MIEFPKVFDEDKSTKKIYQEVLDSRVDKSFDGLSFTLITYGISGSGKTHTTFGSKKINGQWEDGLFFYTAKKIFKCKEQIEKFKNVRVSASFIEIYNENVYDLMSLDSEEKLKLVESALTHGVQVQNLTNVELRNINHLKSLLKLAQEKRIVSSNLNNLQSSRSHLIVELTLENVNSFDESKNFKSKMRFVDLAGSEKALIESKNTIREGRNINKSLLSLTNCINILSENS